MAAVLASLFSALTGRPVDAERWPMRSIAGSTGTRPGPVTLPPRRGPPCSGPSCASGGPNRCAPTQTRPCADSRRELRDASPALLQGIARILCGDLDGGDASLEDAVSVGEKADAPDDLAVALCERSLVAMAHNQWDRAEVLAGQARTVLRRAGIEESFATPSSARCEPVQPYAGEMSRRRAGNCSVPSTCDLC